MNEQQTTIQALIDKALAPKPRVRSGKWNPSSFGYCYRSQYWNRMDEPKSNPPDARSMRVMQAGKLFHDFVQNLMGDVETEVSVESDDVKGFADIVRGNEVVDIKSQHSKSFWWMNKKACDIREEKYGNWLQVLYYARELGRGFGRLVFVSKDDLCIKEYVQPLDDYWLDGINLELTALRYLWKKQELPPASPRCKPAKAGTYWHCEYCNWKDKCNLLEKGE